MNTAQIRGIREMHKNMKPTETARHTPGPWRTIGRAIVTKDARIEIAVASTNDTNDDHVNENHRVIWEEAETNARLIAAAPAMLEALTRTLDALETAHEYASKTAPALACVKWAETESAARAAICAATGEE